MSSAGISLLIGFVFLYGGGEALVRGAEALALRFGIKPLVVGLTVVAFATSSPELVVSISAALDDLSDVAIGNVVGSNICNIALVLGLAALIRPLTTQIQLVKFDVPILIFCSLLLWVVLLDGVISRNEGLGLLLGIGFYLLFCLWQVRRENKALEDIVSEELPATTSSFTISLVLVVIGVAALIYGGSQFVTGAVVLAKNFGVSEAVIGLTVVALGTSLPELAATLVATFKGKTDIAIGNAIGSSIFNILAILGITSIVTPLQQGAIRELDIAIMIGFSILVLPLMFSSLRLNRWEGGIMLLAYGAYIYSLTL